MGSFMKSFAIKFLYVVLFLAVFLIAIPKDKVYYTLLDTLSTYNINFVATKENISFRNNLIEDLNLYLSNTKIE